MLYGGVSHHVARQRSVYNVSMRALVRVDISPATRQYDTYTLSQTMHISRSVCQKSGKCLHNLLHEFETWIMRKFYLEREPMNVLRIFKIYCFDHI